MALNRPLVWVAADFTAGPPNVPKNNSVGLNGAALTGLRGFTTSRGRQYELGHAEAGTMALDFTDTSEALNPANTASPWNSGINTLLPYRCVQVGAWWNTATNDTTGNLINSTNVTLSGNTYDPGFEGASLAWVSSFVGAPSKLFGNVPHTGSHDLQVAFSATADTVGFVFRSVPGQQYTVSAWIDVPISSHTITMAVRDWTGALGTTIGSATTTLINTYERLTVTGKAVGGISAVTFKIATGTTTTIHIDDIQVELGAVATTFANSGPTYFAVWTGYIERYPQTWDSAGFRGIKPLDCVDALSVLSRTIIKQSYLDLILSDGPSVVVPYDDSAPPHRVLRPDSGAPIYGYTHPGTNGTVNYGGDQWLDGTSTINVVQQNATPPVSGDPQYITYVGTQSGAVSMNPQAFTLELWFKFSSGTIYMGAAEVPSSESVNTEATGPQRAVQFYTGAGSLFVVYNDPNGSGKSILLAGANRPADGAWHYAAILFPGSNQIQSVCDLTVGSVIALGFTPSAAVGLNNIFLDATTYFADIMSSVSAAYLALYPRPLGTLEMADHYQRGIGYLGETFGDRATRLLTKWWGGSKVVAAGVMTMAPDFAYNGRSVLAALEEMGDTEQGLTWCDAAGVIHVDSRDTRILAGQTSSYTFGENTAGGELPYSGDVSFDYDPTYVYSQADMSNYAGTVFSTVNATSQTAYGQRILATTINASSDFLVQQAGLYFTTRYAVPKLRISKLSLNPAANPQLWTAALNLDVGDRVTVKRRTNAVTISAEFYIEQINHTVNNEDSSWTVDYQLSPVFLPTAWILGDSTYGVLGTTTVCAY